MATTKRCTKCKEVKGIDQFHKQWDSKDGHKIYCKSCISKEGKEYYLRKKGVKLCKCCKGKGYV